MEVRAISNLSRCSFRGYWNTSLPRRQHRKSPCHKIPVTSNMMTGLTGAELRRPSHRHPRPSCACLQGVLEEAVKARAVVAAEPDQVTEAAVWETDAGVWAAGRIWAEEGDESIQSAHCNQDTPPSRK